MRISSVAIAQLGASRLEPEIFVGFPPRKHKAILLEGAGFRSVVNTIGSNTATAAERVSLNHYYSAILRLSYCHVPAENFYPDEAVVNAFAGALRILPQPTFLLTCDYQLAANLWALARANGWNTQEICEKCTKFDLKSDELLRRITVHRSFVSGFVNDTIH